MSTLTPTNTPAHDRLVTAGRLLRTAVKHSYDPEVELDWESEPVPGLWWVPEHRVSLYGTPLWEQMSLEQRIELSRHECASAHAIELWVETVLMQMLIRYVYTQDASEAHAWHVYTEIAEECRHSTMFGMMIRKSGAPFYGPGRRLKRLGKVFGAVASPTLCMASALFFEEYGDALQREVMNDETCQPIVRAASRLHVIEEARHITFARDELARRVPELSPWERRYVAAQTGPFAYSVVSSMIHPRVYAAVGLDIDEALRQVRANPHRAETQRWASATSVELFESLGLVDRFTRQWWRRAQII
ncbi:MAG: diiron oxygenase [Actinobacteria bacterium]|uniref:Unannotated protein n=1 Tax=freshwater metagenome TaxID=449393 RepID=A0A6J6R8P5_9ZZZZ|nr:diiron oxygenase [Actinomycetota bacterium]